MYQHRLAHPGAASRNVQNLNVPRHEKECSLGAQSRRVVIHLTLTILESMLFYRRLIKPARNIS
jgi:hypothetical protein